MFATASEATLRERYYHTVRDVGHMEHARSCNIDYDREMTLVAEIRQNGERRLIGTGGIVIEPHTKRCEFAILVHDEFQGAAGLKILDFLIVIAGEKGLLEFSDTSRSAISGCSGCAKTTGGSRSASDDPVRSCWHWREHAGGDSQAGRRGRCPERYGKEGRQKPPQARNSLTPWDVLRIVSGNQQVHIRCNHGHLFSTVPGAGRLVGNVVIRMVQTCPEAGFPGSKP